MKNLIVLAVAAVVLAGAAGCVQMPTERQGVADVRPQISFVTETQHREALVYLDDVAVGKVGDYLDGRAALRVVPGTHDLRVVHGARVLLQERFYVGDGVSKSFVIR